MVIHKGHEREFRALQEILNHHFALAKCLSNQHVTQGLIRFFLVLRNHHSFSGGKAVVLQYSGISIPLANIRHRLLVVGKRAVSRSRHVIFRHQLFRKLLAGFNLGGGFGMAKNRNTRLTESVCHAGIQSRFRSHHAEIDFILFGKSQQCLHLRIFDSHTLSQLRNTGISRRTEDLTDLFTAAQLIHDGVLTTAGSYDEYFFHA